MEINWHPTRKELRVFSALWIVFFAIIGGIVYRRTGSSGLAWAILLGAALVGIGGLLWPRAIRPVYLVWMVAAFPIGWTISHLVLAAVFYFLCTPIGLLLRLAGKDAMKRSFDRGADSYWDPKTSPREPRSYFRQY